MVGYVARDAGGRYIVASSLHTHTGRKFAIRYVTSIDEGLVADSLFWRTVIKAMELKHVQLVRVRTTAQVIDDD